MSNEQLAMSEDQRPEASGQSSVMLLLIAESYGSVPYSSPLMVSCFVYHWKA
jgi:hypothetical protein